MSQPKPRSVQQWIDWGARQFLKAGLHFGHGTDNARDESEVLVRWALRLPLQLTPARQRQVPGPRRAQRVANLLQARIDTRKPAAYLTGESWFAGLRFEVDERVLIPRSPIAELIVNRFRPWITSDPLRILDLCSGSGCLAIACARAFPRARVDAVELDPGALQVLRRNIRRHRLGTRVRAIRSDLFESLGRRRYDLIVTNPPYVPTQRCDVMPAEYQHEPRMALEAGGDGMDLVDRILRAAPGHLAPAGTLVCEVGGYVPEFNSRYPDLPVMWPEFEYGGDGVLVASNSDLIAWNQGNVR